MMSTITGDSGRVYTDGKVLYRHPDNSKFVIFKVKCDNKSFICKHVMELHFNVLKRIANDILTSTRLRMHVDCKAGESVLMYSYFRDTLLDLLQTDPGFSAQERVKVLQAVASALKELHAKDWMHGGDAEGNKTITDVALVDLDLACSLKKGESRIKDYAMGNLLWRSPEGHTHMDSRASNIYSLGLVFIYILGLGDLIIPTGPVEPAFPGSKPELEILLRHFFYFGPVPELFYQQIYKKNWITLLRIASEIS